MTYYSVVGGWTLGYIVKSATGLIATMTDNQNAEEVFSRFIRNPYEMLLYHFLFMAATVFIVMRGIKNGIERWNKSSCRSFSHTDRADTQRVDQGRRGGRPGLLSQARLLEGRVKTVIEAMGQCFFSLSLGMGAMITTQLPEQER